MAASSQWQTQINQLLTVFNALKHLIVVGVGFAPVATEQAITNYVFCFRIKAPQCP